MPGYKLTVEGEEIEIFFEKGQICILQIGGTDAYEFSEGIDGMGGLTVTLSDALSFFLPEDFNIESIDEDTDFLMDSEEGHNSCCMVRDQMWCVVNGCMKAPCGKICG